MDSALQWLRWWRGWIVTILVILVVPLFLWLLEPDVIGPIQTTRDMLYVTARWAALSALAAFAWSLVLGARLHWTDRLFRGIDRVVKTHHYVGAFSLGAILTHVLAITIMIALSSPEAALRLWIPSVDSLYIAYGILTFIGMLALFIITIAIDIRYDWFLRLHWILGALFFPAAHHAFGAGTSLTNNEYLYWYLAALSGLGMLSFAYGTLLAPPFVRRYPYTVSAVRHLSQDLTEIILRPKWRPIRFKPGQFAYLRLTDSTAVKKERHPFSFSSSSHSNIVSFTVKKLGDYTSDLANLQPGRKATLMGPYGYFSYLDAKNKKQIWIAGGIGVTPFLSMIRSLPHRLRHSIDFYYCTKGMEDATFLDEIKRLTRDKENFRLHHICQDRDGFLNIDGIRKTAENDILEADIFMCGSPAMRKSLTTQFTEAGVPDYRLHFEDFSF